MAARKPPGPQPPGAVPPAVMENYLKLKQEQDSTSDEFERRVADTRRQLLERHAQEQQAFWTGQPCVAWQPPNGHAVALPDQQVSQRAVNQAPLPGPRKQAQDEGSAAQGHANAPINAPKRAAMKAEPPTAIRARARTLVAAQHHSQSVAEAQPQHAPKPRTKAAPKGGEIEIVDLCSDDDVEPSRSTTATSGQRVEFNFQPPSSGVLSFFGRNDNSEVIRPNVKGDEDLSKRQSPASFNTPVAMDVSVEPTQVSHGPSLSSMQTLNGPRDSGTRPASAVPSPVQKDSSMLQDRQTQLGEGKINMDLKNSPGRPGGKYFQSITAFSRSFEQPEQQHQQRRLVSANDTLCHPGGQDRVLGPEKASARQTEDIDMEGLPAETKQNENGPNVPHRSHTRGGKLSDRQNDNTDAEHADRDARAEYEKQRQRFMAIVQANGTLPAAIQAQWMEINETGIKRREELERTLQNAKAVGMHNATDSDGCIRRVKDKIRTPSCVQGSSAGRPQTQANTATDYQHPQQAFVESPMTGNQNEKLYQGDVSATGVDASSYQPYHRALDRQHQSLLFKVPRAPNRAVPINERTRREDTVTSRASSQTLPGHSIVATEKGRPDRLPLPTPPNSVVSPTRKRKVHHNVSDDSDVDPDFEPPSSDDEPLINRRHKPVVKKAKGVNGSGSARPVSLAPKIGFKHVKLTKPNRSVTPARPTTKTTAPATPESSLSSLDSESPSVQAAQRSSSRRAKQKALAALDEHFQKDFEFYNEEDIREADERKQRLKDIMPASTEATLRRTLQRMSLTPVPPSACPDSDRIETDGAQEANRRAHDGGRKRTDSVYGLVH
ncbi:uncharacterized protein CC84DRAFT_1261825 [Paraphaeosphaeria sporulosa]|uniref:Uncharacterized protein n=1 Tax=Paraphaeosphaeria sporulosa TaxID=1460663 RepID=A0A177C6G1_9PLEO|nr:uncharacterized protein CC84DRAFT_1261825 [Paraphaeosphaeria sporulosa]OAG03223.1 hypothetical protein CC84DRAFT_1261825 [Paraphaeosphaeria sporulosa]